MNWNHLQKDDLYAVSEVITHKDGHQTRLKARRLVSGDVEVEPYPILPDDPVTGFSVERSGQQRMALDVG